jgi:hypothetical protein
MWDRDVGKQAWPGSIHHFRMQYHTPMHMVILLSQVDTSNSMYRSTAALHGFSSLRQGHKSLLSVRRVQGIDRCSSRARERRLPRHGRHSIDSWHEEDMVSATLAAYVMLVVVRFCHHRLCSLPCLLYLPVHMLLMLCHSPSGEFERRFAAASILKQNLLSPTLSARVCCARRGRLLSSVCSFSSLSLHQQL